MTAIIGVLISYGAALVTARSTLNAKLKSIVEAIALVINTIPGMVLGIAFMLTFTGTNLQSTFIILIICDVVHYFSTPYLMVKNSLSKMNASWETTAMLMGDSWIKTIIRVVTPNAMSTILEVFSYYFVNAMVTISAIIFLAGAHTMVITTKIKELQYYNKFNEVFVLSVLILSTNIMWGNTKKSGIYTTHPKHFGENFRGTDWHWYDVNDCWCFADEWLGKPVKVDVYGAGDEAEFVLNGKSLGRKPIEKLMASMDIPYETGILEGVVYKDGAKISRSTLVTPKEAAVLELVPEEESFVADGKDLSYVRVTLKDADGNRLTQDEREIQVETDGVGTFLAVGSGNPCTEDQITDTKCHLYRGTAIVILKSKEAGETKIMVKADGVAAGSCVVEAK